MMGTNSAYDIRTALGVFTPKLHPVDELGPGEIGMLTASIKEVADTRVGDTITDDRQADRGIPLPGFRPAIPVVFCGLFPVDADAVRGIARRPSGRASLERRQLFSLRNGDEAPLSVSVSVAASSDCYNLEIIQERLRLASSISI